MICWTCKHKYTVKKDVTTQEIVGTKIELTTVTHGCKLGKTGDWQYTNQIKTCDFYERSLRFVTDG